MTLERYAKEERERETKEPDVFSRFELESYPFLGEGWSRA
jgi:hypothetical protein